MSGHLPCTATLSMSRHISTLNYLRSADICRTRTVIYWLSVPAITDSANKSRVFGGHFNPKSLVRTLTAIDSSLKFQCCRLVTTSNISYRCLRDEPRDCGRWNSSIGYVRFMTSCHKCHVFNPLFRRRERFLVWTSDLMCCAAWMESIV